VDPFLPAWVLMLLLPVLPCANLTNCCRTKPTGWCSAKAVTSTTASTTPARTTPLATFLRRRALKGAISYIMVTSATCPSGLSAITRQEDHRLIFASTTVQSPYVACAPRVYFITGPG
jgi:hypothetical protein